MTSFVSSNINTFTDVELGHHHFLIMFGCIVNCHQLTPLVPCQCVLLSYVNIVVFFLHVYLVVLLDIQRHFTISTDSVHNKLYSFMSRRIFYYTVNTLFITAYEYMYIYKGPPTSFLIPTTENHFPHPFILFRSEILNRSMVRQVNLKKKELVHD